MQRFKDAELTLMNIIECLSAPAAMRRYMHDPKHSAMAWVELLVHLINHMEESSGSKRIAKVARQVLALDTFKLLQGDEAAYAHFVIGISFFLSENVEYAECKLQLKYALTHAIDPHLKGLILHNLAVMNYCEITDHNERVLNPPSNMES